MTLNATLTLDQKDPRVILAREAEAKLYADYGITPHHTYLPLGTTGMRIRISIVGSGQPIVVVPGNTGDGFPLIPLMAAMPGRKLIVINRPGGGLSDGMDHRTVDIRKFAVETLETVMQALDLHDADFLAHSMGAHWSLWLAMDRPNLVRRLVTLGNPGNVLTGNPPLILRLLVKPPLNLLFGRILAPKNSKDNLRMLRMMGHEPAVLKSLPASYGDCYGRFRRLPHFKISALSLLQNAAPQITSAELKAVGAPVLLLWGSKDTFAPVETGRQIAQALPDGALQEIAGAGHLPWLEDADRCGALASGFLDN